MLLDVIPEITFAILCVFKVSKQSAEWFPHQIPFAANPTSIWLNHCKLSDLFQRSTNFEAKVWWLWLKWKKLRCHDYNYLSKACLVGRLNYISVKSAHFEQRKRTGGKIQMFSIQVRQHWNREDATFCPLFIPICRFYSTEGEQLHNEGNDKNRISDAMYIHEILFHENLWFIWTISSTNELLCLPQTS